MRWAIEAFRENTGMEHEQSAKLFFFMLKAVSAMAYLFVLGYLAAGQAFDDTVMLILLLGAVIDLVPEAVTLRIRDRLPEKARAAEDLQLVLKAVAYLMLAAVITRAVVDLYWSYVAFLLLWLLSFLIEESVLFLVRVDE